MTDKICSVEGCGRKYSCKGFCLKHYINFRMQTDPEFKKKRYATNNEWTKANPDKVVGYRLKGSNNQRRRSAEYARKNPEKRKQSRDKYRQNNATKVKYSNRKSRIKNREKINAYKVKRRQKNPEKARKKDREYRDRCLVKCCIKQGLGSFGQDWNLSDKEVQDFLLSYKKQIKLTYFSEEFAVKSGWPATLNYRETQILNICAACGVPVSSGEICEILKITRQVVVRNTRLLQEKGLLAVIYWGKKYPKNTRYILDKQSLSILEERSLCDVKTEKSSLN